MEKNLIGKEAYQQHFNPKDFLNTHIPFGCGNRSDGEEMYDFILKNLHKAFLLDGVKGDTLIDIGTGPSIYHLLSACESFQEIIATDLLEQNREEMQKWLKKDPDMFNWTPIVKHVCQLEGDREKWVEKQEKLRKTIKQVLRCDVTQANPLDPLVIQPVSCVLSIFCLESACKDLPVYNSAVRNVGSLVKPGGHLIFVVIIRGSYYMVGKSKFLDLYLTPEMVEAAVKEAGFNIVTSEMFGMELPALSHAHDINFLVAQKCKQV